MKKQKVNSFTKEFPFLTSIQLDAKFSWDEVSRIDVKRVDQNLLLKTPKIDAWNWGDNGTMENGDVVFSISKQGNIKRLASEYEFASASGRGEYDSHTLSTPIYQQIDLSLRFLVELSYDENFKCGGGIETKINVTIYKLGNFDLIGFQNKKFRATMARA